MAELSPQHEEMLIHGSAIDSRVVNGRGYTSLEWNSKSDPDYQRLREVGIESRFRKSNDGSGLLIPMYGPDGALVAYQWRPDEPIKITDPKTNDVREVKYVSTSGQKNRLDIHPSNTAKIKDISTSLFITEGVKKADSLTSRGFCAIGLAGVYSWRDKLGRIGDWEDVPLKGREVVICFDSDTVDNSQVAKAMGRLGAWLKYKQAKHVYYLVVPKGFGGIPTKGIDDYFAAGGTWESIKSEVKSSAPDLNRTGDEFSDYYLAELAVEECFEGRFCWTDDTRWMEYDGKKWNRVSDRAALGHLAQFAAGKHAIAATEYAEKSTDANKREMEGWSSMLNLKKLAPVLKIAESMPGVYKKADEAVFDYRHDLLNCPNGVVDLRTGKLLNHDPDYMMTKITKVDYIPGAMHEKWDKALTVLPEDVIEYAQFRFGQSITGYMPDDDIMVLMEGGGENGKSTIVGAATGTLGSYYGLISSKVLLSTGKSEHTTEMTDLQGLRWAQLEETAEAGRLDVTKLKQVVGTAQITARRMRQDNITFDSTHSLFISTNHRPIVNETDHGSWRRLMLLRFPYRYVKDPKPLVHEMDRRADHDLRWDCENDPEIHKAALAWLVMGAQKWFANGDGTIGKMPPTPQRIERDTLEWRAENDLVLKYITEALVFDPDATVPTSHLNYNMNVWLRNQSQGKWSEKTFTQRFQPHSEVRAHGVTKGRFRMGPNTSVSGYVDNDSEPPHIENQFSGYKGVRFRTKADEEV